MQQSPSVEANRSCASQEIFRILGTRRIITWLTRARYLSLSWATSIQSMSHHPTSGRSILILSSHLLLGLPSVSISQVFPLKPLMHPSSPLYVLHAPPILFFSDTPTIAQKVFRAQFLCTFFGTLLWWQLMTAIGRIYTVIPAYNGTARDRFFFPRLRLVPFNTNTWSLDPRD